MVTGSTALIVERDALKARVIELESKLEGARDEALEQREARIAAERRLSSALSLLREVYDGGYDHWSTDDGGKSWQERVEPILGIDVENPCSHSGAWTIARNSIDDILGMKCKECGLVMESKEWDRKYSRAVVENHRRFSSADDPGCPDLRHGLADHCPRCGAARELSE